jgi:hypothetical protein
VNILLYERGIMSISYRHSDLFLEAAKYGHWWEKRHFQLWFRGKTPHKDKLVETTLARLGRRKKNNLKVGKYGKKDIYAIPRYYKNFDPADPDKQHYLYHELACTETLVRIYRSNMDCELFHQHVFRGYGSVPEWAVRYENGLMYLGEFSTKSDTGNNLTKKITNFPKSIPYIERDFGAQVVVLFILDIERWKVQDKVRKLKPNGPFRFIDYKSFLDTPIGSALDAPCIYPDGSIDTL